MIFDQSALARSTPARSPSGCNACIDKHPLLKINVRCRHCDKIVTKKVGTVNLDSRRMGILPPRALIGLTTQEQNMSRRPRPSHSPAFKTNSAQRAQAGAAATDIGAYQLQCAANTNCIEL